MHLAEVDARRRLDGHRVEVERHERHVLRVVARGEGVVHGLVRLASRAREQRAHEALVRPVVGVPGGRVERAGVAHEALGRIEVAELDGDEAR